MLKTHKRKHKHTLEEWQRFFEMHHWGVHGSIFEQRRFEILEGNQEIAIAEWRQGQWRRLARFNPEIAGWMAGEYNGSLNDYAKDKDINLAGVQFGNSYGLGCLPLPDVPEVHLLLYMWKYAHAYGTRYEPKNEGFFNMRRLFCKDDEVLPNIKNNSTCEYILGAMPRIENILTTISAAFLTNYQFRLILRQSTDANMAWVDTHVWASEPFLLDGYSLDSVINPHSNEYAGEIVVYLDVDREGDFTNVLYAVGPDGARSKIQRIYTYGPPELGPRFAWIELDEEFVTNGLAYRSLMVEETLKGANNALLSALTPAFSADEEEVERYRPLFSGDQLYVHLTWSDDPSRVTRKINLLDPYNVYNGSTVIANQFTKQWEQHISIPGFDWENLRAACYLMGSTSDQSIRFRRSKELISFLQYRPSYASAILDILADFSTKKKLELQVHGKTLTISLDGNGYECLELSQKEAAKAMTILIANCGTAIDAYRANAQQEEVNDEV